MKKWIIRIVVTLLLILAGVLLRRTVFAPEPVAVEVARAAYGSVEATITNSKAGTVKARRRAGLSTGTAGIVVALEVQRGDRVESGQMLLRLDDATQQSQLLYAQRHRELADAKNDRACLAAERARREWERNDQLAKERVVSMDRLDALRTVYELATADCIVAGADVELAKASVEVARAELDKTVLVAPFEAIVADVAVELGEWVTPSVALIAAPDLIDAIDPSSLYISAPMDEVDAQLLRLSQRVRVTIDSFPDRTFWGNVVRIAPYVLDVEQQNRTLEIEVELDDAKFSASLLPGTSADVEVVLEVREEVLRVPTFALREGKRVLVVEQGVLVERSVETGIRNWDWTEISGGLEAGDPVVTSLDRPDVDSGVRIIVESDGEPR